MAKLYNLARMTTATTGTGTITLGSAVASYVTFALAGVQNGDTVTYAIVDGNNREVGRGVYTSAGTTLTRATILESTNANAAISLSGNAEVFITAAAEDITSSVEITGGSITGITDLAIADGGTGQSTASAAANALNGYLTIASSGGTTILTNTSPRTIVVTGTLGHTIQLPDVTTLALGWSFVITNTSTGSLGTNSSGGNALGFTAAGMTSRFVCVAVTGTGTSSWSQSFIGSTSRVGSGSIVFAGTPTLTTPLIASLSGGTAASSTLTLQSTTGVGTTDAIILRTGSQAERFRIDTSGALGIGGANYGTSGQVLTSGGSGAAPSWSNLNLTNPAIVGTIVEDVFTITDAAGFAIDPSNGSVQLVTLGANRTPTVANFSDGQSVTLMVNDGSNFAITWTTIGVVWVGGPAPILPTTGYGVIQLWKVASVIYGAYVGAVS